MKKIILFAMSALMLVGCGLSNSAEDDDSQGGKTEEKQLPTIERLNAKYNGFEIHYTNVGSSIYVGGKNDVYWVYAVDYDDPTIIKESSVISEKNGSEWINYYYSGGEFVTYGTSKDRAVAAETANSQYLQLMLGGLSAGTKSETTLKGENVICYSMGMGSVNVYVNATDGYTMQTTYGDETNASLVFSEVNKGNSVDIPQYK